MTCASAAVPVCGKLGDLFGRKRVFLAALVVFLAASALCGIAQTMTQLIAARIVQGIGSGGLFICVLALIGEMFSRARAPATTAGSPSPSAPPRSPASPSAAS